MNKNPGDLFSSLKNFILPDARPAFDPLSNTVILEELIACFDHSCRRESVGNSLLFNMHFVIMLHPDVFDERSPSFPVICKEAVKVFYKKLEGYSKKYADISPVSNNWFFRFAPGTECYGERIEKHGIRLIGMLNGLKVASHAVSPQHQTARVTMKSRVTNLFDSMDIHLDVLRNINFAENNSFQIKFSPDLRLSTANEPRQPDNRQTRNYRQQFAELLYYQGEANTPVVYQMKDPEIVIARREAENLAYTNYLLIDSPFVSNPHARIRFVADKGIYQIASFSRNETRVNERVVERSDPGHPVWTDLHPKSQILINSMVTLQFKSQA